MNNSMFLQSAPMPIQWAGWTSDTVTLQRHGWRFAHEQNVSSLNSINIVMTHPQARVIALLDEFELWNNYRGPLF